ncbi:MAG: rRNA maturation RNase YbeY [Spirochaetia bacterium]
MVEILWQALLPPDYEKDRILTFSQQVAAYCGICDENDFSLVFVDDTTIRQMNLEYRDKDEATDVLSFAFADQQDWPSDGPQILGEIFISTQTLARNAEYFGVLYEVELKRLIVHGILHLLGEDHRTNDLDEPMLQKQEQILSNFMNFSLKFQ